MEYVKIILFMIFIFAIAASPISILSVLMVRKKELRRWMLTPAESKPYSEIIFWWELRRLHYNSIMLFFGFIGFFFMMLMIGIFNPKLDFDFFIAIFGGIPLFAIAANVMYMGGWGSEIVVRYLWKEKARYFGPIMWSLGTAFSICVCFLPGMAHFIAWLLGRT